MYRIVLQALVWRRLVFFGMVLKATLRKQSSKQSLPYCSEAHCGDSGQVFSIKWLSTSFQISDLQHGIYLNGKLSTNLLAQTANKNVKILSSYLRELGGFFFLNMVSEVTVPKKSEQTLPQVEKVTVQKFVIRFWTVTFRSSRQKFSMKKLFLKTS